MIPRKCKSIASKDFAKCKALKYVLLPTGVDVKIASDAFSGSKPVMLYY